MKLAINGLGRIGRLLLRLLMDRPDIEIVGVNDTADTRTLAHLIRYDSVHRKAPFPVSFENDVLLLGPRRIPIFHEADPAHIPFGELGARVVVECTGKFTARAEAAKHLRGTVTHVVLSAPAEDADFTVVMGINEARLDVTRHQVISSASCTANCLAPMVKVMDDAFGVVCGLVTTVHSYTNDQRILDLPHPDLRRARAASMSMIPTSTGAADAIDAVLPHLKGKITGIAVRVPTPDVSITDLSLTLAQDTTLAQINAAFRAAAEHDALSPYLDIVEDEIVSVDLTGSTASCIFDPFLTKAMTPRFVKVFGWYDNEFGYAARLQDLTVRVLERIREDVR